MTERALVQAALSVEAEEALIALVRETARDEILPRFRRLSPDDVSSKTTPDDLVTAADLAAEAAIAAGVSRILPGARIVGEEGVAADPSLLDYLYEPGLTVVIDPIDGTWNFANGLAVFGVLLSVLDGGETILGILYDPLLDDWVMARRGGGTWFCREGAAPRRLWMSDRAGPEAPGVVPLYLFPKARRADVAHAMSEGERTLWLRCSCHEYRLMALGALDHVISLGPKPWDHTAGVLAILEAGGVARCANGTSYHATRADGAIVAAATEAGSRSFALRTGSRRWATTTDFDLASTPATSPELELSQSTARSFRPSKKMSSG